jgi:hypothetical protein
MRLRDENWMTHFAERPEEKCLPVWERKSTSVDKRIILKCIFVTLYIYIHIVS